MARSSARSSRFSTAVGQPASSSRNGRLLQRDEALVVAGIGNTNFDLWAAGRRPQNFYMLGSMGLACPIALGVALAQPDRGVVALEGDGSLLMQLGGPSMHRKAAPEQHVLVVVMDNGRDQITGAQPTATAAAADLVAIARGCGLSQSEWAADEGIFESLLARALDGDGPSLIAVRIDDKPAEATTERDPRLIRDRFMQGLGVRR